MEEDFEFKKHYKISLKFKVGHGCNIFLWQN